jgi:hypothetical protein
VFIQEERLLSLRNKIIPGITFVFRIQAQAVSKIYLTFFK